MVMGGSCGHSLLIASIFFFSIEIRSKTHQTEIGEAVLEL